MTKIRFYLAEKRKELIYALSEQDYNNAQIGEMFRMSRLEVKRLVDNKPENYKTKWVKKENL